MAKRKQQQYQIRQPVRGSFIGALGRVRYEVEAGIVDEKGIDPEVLDVLLAYRRGNQGGEARRE